MSENNLMKLVCEDCGGTMNIDSDKNVILCPFCGSKKIIFESDEVKIAQIKANAEIEKQRIMKDVEIKKQEAEESARKTRNEYVTIFISLLSLVVMLAFMYFVGFFG